MSAQLSTERRYTCDQCGKEFKNVAGLLGHLYYVHKLRKRKEDLYERFPWLKEESVRKSMERNDGNILPTVSSAPAIPSEELSMKTRLSEIQLTPISRPVKLNAVVLLYYDEARKMGYDGDLGDFITECVVEYFRDKLKLRLGFFREAE